MSLFPVLEGLDVTIYGIPAHPLVVHAAVVLVPLAAIAFAGLAWRQRWRDLYLLPIALLALAGAFSSFLAAQTGEALEESIEDTGRRLGEHPEQGDTAFIFAVLFGLLAAGTYVLHNFGPQIRTRLGLSNRLRLPVSDVRAAYTITVPVAAVALVMMVIAGHSGANLVWKTP